MEVVTFSSSLKRCSREALIQLFGGCQFAMLVKCAALHGEVFLLPGQNNRNAPQCKTIQFSSATNGLQNDHGGGWVNMTLPCGQGPHCRLLVSRGHWKKVNNYRWNTVNTVYRDQNQLVVYLGDCTNNLLPQKNRFSVKIHFTLTH